MTVRGTTWLLVDLALLAAMMASSPAPARLAGPPPACRNGFYLVAGTALARLDASSGRYLPVATLPVLVNALGYAADQNVFYGVAGSRVVTVDEAGRLTNRGVAPAGTTGAYSGAIQGDRWYLRSGGALRVLSIDPASRQYLHVIATVTVHIVGLLGDWDINPADGRLYGLVTGGGGPVRLIRVDPVTGAVAVLARPAALPDHSSYGGVAIDSDGTLAALYNATGTLYTLPLAHPNQVSTRQLPGGGGADATGHDDAAGCPRAWDFGDAPASYRTTLAQDGPRHLLTEVGQLTIGAGVDAEPDGVASATASGDSDDGLHDPVRIGVDGAIAELTVPVRNTTGSPALLAGWLDSNANGGFEAPERAVAPVPSGAHTVTLHWPLTASAVRDRPTFLRLRLYGQVPANPTPVGPALGGEVEDHQVRLAAPPPPVASPSPSPTPSPSPPPSPTPSPKVILAPPAPVVPPHRPSPPVRPTPPPRVIPVPKPAAHKGSRPPWQPTPAFNVTWSVVVLMLIPAAACTARIGGRTLHRRR